MVSMMDNHRKVEIALSPQQSAEVDGKVQGCTMTLIIKQILNICLLSKHGGMGLDVHLFNHFPALGVPAFGHRGISFLIAHAEDS